MLKKSIFCGAILVCMSMQSMAADVNTPTTSTMQETLSDVKITAKIKAAYLMSPLIKTLNISVTTTNQIVVLSGVVTTDQEYERAVTIANSIEGVKAVNVDNLKVTASKSPIADTIITAKVKGKFLKEKLFGDKEIEFWPVSVETKDGVVYLTGVVATEVEQDNLIQLAKDVKDVKSVSSTITVRQ